MNTDLIPRTGLVLVLPFLLLVTACGDDEATVPAQGGTGGTGATGAAGGTGGGSGGVAGGTVDGGGGTAGIPNPNGLGPAPVELGDTTNLAAPGSYVLLAKAAITNVTGSMITGGHVGLSPAAATFITGFSLVADSSTAFSTSVSVASPFRVFASNYGGSTPANLTSAVLGMETAYTDAAGRSNPDFLNLGSGEIGGETLAPGLYTWGTTVTIPNDVALHGGAKDVWIMQISDDLLLSSATKVNLTGGAQAKNVFWQVAGQATLGANSHFEGILLTKTGITLQTNATMVGRALSQTMIALDDNDITAAP